MDAVQADEVLNALRELIDVLERTSPRDRIIERAHQIEQMRADGLPYAEIATHELRPLVVEMVGEHIDALIDASGRLRRAQARALHDEGLSMAEIAKLFGVTRQRISQLLNDHHTPDE